MDDDYGARVRDWVDLVRRARLGKTVKYVAYAMAQYADADGTRIFPGIARLAVECEVSYNTVKTALDVLRDYELVELVRESTGRGRSDEYRLILGARVMDKVEVPSPAQITLSVERLREARRGKHRPKPTPTDDLRHAGHAAEPVDNPDDTPVDNSDLRPATQAADEKSAARLTYAETGSAARPTVDLRHVPRPPTNHVPNTTTTNHYSADVETAVTGPRGGPPEDPISGEENQPRRGRHAAPEPDNVIPFPKAKAS